MDGESDATRRRLLRMGGVATGALLAGCIGGESDGPDEVDDGDGTEDEPSGGESSGDGSADGDDGGDGSDDGEDGATESEDGGDESGYTVTMEPVGEVTFDAVPETWFPYTGDYADMGVALGQGDGLLAVGIKERFASHYYDELPGVSVNKDDLVQLWQDGTDVEVFYELDADVHLIDPNFMINRINWEREDVEDIAEQVAPFVGNTVFSGSYPWHEDYEYYSLYEAFEKVAEVFQERERYEAMKQIHDDALADVQSQLPDEPAEVAMLYPYPDPPNTFLPFLIDDGTGFKQWRQLEVRDALGETDVADFHENRGEIDAETLLEIDPEVIAVRQHGEVTEADFEEQIVEPMREHPVTGELQAVQNDRVIRGGAPYQGPIVHLFQLEQAAQELYPEQFDGELFDRQAVADVVNGEF